MGGGSIRSSDMSEVVALSMFCYKFEGRGRMHKVTTAADSLADLKAAVAGRVGIEAVSALQYEDEDGDRIVLQMDEDLQAAVALARAKQMKARKGGDAGGGCGREGTLVTVVSVWLGDDRH